VEQDGRAEGRKEILTTVSSFVLSLHGYAAILLSFATSPCTQFLALPDKKEAHIACTFSCRIKRKKWGNASLRQASDSYKCWEETHIQRHDIVLKKPLRKRIQTEAYVTK